MQPLQKPQNSIDKPHQNVSEKKRRARALPDVFSGKRRFWFGLLVANGVGQAMLAVAMAIVIKSAFDTLVVGGAITSTRPIILYVTILGAVISINAILRWRSHIDAEQLGQSYVHSVRSRLFRHVTRIGADGARQMSKGALMLRFVGDLSALRQWVSLGLSRLIVGGLAIGLSLLVLFLVEPVIAVAVAIAVVVTATASLLIGAPLQQATYEARRRRGKLAARLNDRISRIGVVEAFGQERRERQQFKKLSSRVRTALIGRAWYVGMLRAISEAGSSFAGVIALATGALLSRYGMATPGAIVAAMAVSGLLAPRIQDLGRVYEYWNAAQVARQKQLDLLMLDPVSRPSGGHERSNMLRSGPGKIVFENVSFQDRINLIDLTIPDSERVVVIGSNGAGKSLFLKLSSGVIQPTSGKVFLDGQNLAKCNWQDVRKAFAIVSPDLPLLRGTLLHNLTYGAQDVSSNAIEDVIDKARLSSLIERLDKGLSSRIAENGEGLSTGERARIALARALLVNARVLILDEADANLDAEATDALDTVFNAHRGTVLAATHNLAFARKADRLIHFEGGSIAFSGAPADHFLPVQAFESKIMIAEAKGGV